MGPRAPGHPRARLPWAPTAQAVELRLYDNGTYGLPETVVTPRRLDRGVWEYRPGKLLYGKYYD